MFKRIFGSKPASIILDAIGVFSLASFLFLGFYLRFIVDILPSCYFTDALIVYVECGKGVIGEGLKFYFQFFSPLIVWIAPLLVYSLFMSFTHFALSQFLMALLMSSIILISIGTSFRIIYKILKRLTWKRAAYSGKERLIASLLLLISLTPVLSILAVKFYVEPPKSSGRIITVDMWHSQLNIPRYYLEDWSLINIERPATEPRGTLGHPIHGRRKANPFANLYVSYKEIDPSLTEDEKISIRLVPHYSLLNEVELFQKREDYLQSVIKKTYRRKVEGFKVDHPLYEPVEVTENWEIYKSAVDASGYEPDIYVHKNDQGKIENILECTPRGHCAKKRGPNSWSLPKCKNEDECLKCTRICEDNSFGNTENFISYSFDKKYLDTYFDRHQKILNFIASHTARKPTAKFSFNKDNIASWKEVKGGVSIKLNEDGQKQLLELTRENVNKPLEMYVEDFSVMSPVVREPIGSGSALLAVDGEIREKVISLLPKDKMEQDEQE